jgi:hypothetical protein
VKRSVLLHVVLCVALLAGLWLSWDGRCASEPASQSSDTVALRYFLPLIVRPSRAYVPTVMRNYPPRLFLRKDLPYFIGANTSNFGFYQEYGYSIEEAIRTAKECGITVLRFNIWLGEKPWGWRPMEEYDRVLAIAAQYGMYVIVDITDCCPAAGQTDEGYFRTVPHCNIAHPNGLRKLKEHITSLLSRRYSVNGRIYRDDPNILAWDIANEPRLNFFSDAQITAWVREVAGHVKALDPNHPVTIGLVSVGVEYDRDGPAYERFNVPELDFFSFHAYPLWYPYGINPVSYTSEELSAYLNALRFRVERFAAMGKPVVLEEFSFGRLREVERLLGTKPTEAQLEAWLYVYKAQMDTVFQAGACGVIFWGWGVPETKNVPLWWRNEEHDITETEFCALLRSYRPPLPPLAANLARER